MEFAKIEDLKKMDNNTLLREADVVTKLINDGREQLKLIAGEVEIRCQESQHPLPEGSMLMKSDRQWLKTAIQLLVALDRVTEDKLVEWYTSSELIAEINDFYVEIENDDELRKALE